MNRKWYWYLGIFAVVFGLALSQMLPVRSNTQADASLKNQTLVETIKQLENEISGMENELFSIRKEMDQMQGQQGDRNASRTLQADVQLQQSAAGLTELTGPGIIITLDDNSKGANAAKLNDSANYRPNDYIIHDKNLLYLVNELRAAKAEGISINNQRIVGSSDIRCVGTVIMVNSTRLAPPFEICAVGNISRLTKAIEEGREYHYLKDKDFPISIKPSKNILLPAYPGSYNLKYMTPAETE